jgi:hypothetical protein
MPAKSTTTTSRGTTPKPKPAPPNGGARRPNGNGPAVAPRAAARSNGIHYWPVELVSSGPMDLTLEGEDAQDFGLSICGACSSVIPGSDRARLSHSKWHDMIAAIDQRAG